MEATPVQTYELSPEERATMSALNLQALNAKAKLFDLAQQTEQSRAELQTSMDAFQGALMLMAAAHGMPLVRITPDFARITILGVSQ